jgi:outer membrane protein OmpA-like peptidoglycan-associated protein
MWFAAVTLLAVGCSAPQSINVTEEQRRGVVGPADAQGPVGIVDPWSSFAELWFDFNGVDLQSSEVSKVSAIVAYINENPSVQVGIDRSMEKRGRGTELRDDNLRNRRVDAVRELLIEAGVPDYKIRMGAFGDAGLTQGRRVEMLIRNAYFVAI